MRLAGIYAVDPVQSSFRLCFRVRIVRSRRAGGKTWCTRCPGTVQPWAHDGAPQRDVWGAARRFSCGSGVQSAPGNRGDGVCGLLWRHPRHTRVCLGWELVALIKCPLGRCGINTPTSVTTSQVSQMMSAGRGNISERRQIGFHTLIER